MTPTTPTPAPTPEDLLDRLEDCRKTLVAKGFDEPEKWASPNCPRCHRTEGCRCWG